jgi:hypothetical protein
VIIQTIVLKHALKFQQLGENGGDVATAIEGCVAGARIAAAVVSLNGHKRTRRQPNFVDRNFLGFSNSGKE